MDLLTSIHTLSIAELRKILSDNGVHDISSSKEVLTYKCDILIPAALENTITLKNVDMIKAKLLCLR